MITALTANNTIAFIKIRQASLRLNPLAFGADPDTKIDRAATERDLSEKHEANFILGYFEEGELLGIVGFIRETRVKKRHKGWIWGMFVYPEHRGKGIGKALFAACIEKASLLEGLEKIMLSVTNSAPAALALYQHFGFQAYGTERNAMRWEGQYVDEIFMEKLLE